MHNRKTGQIEKCKYKSNRIYCKDADEYMDAIPKGTVDLIIMDPPYNMKKADWDTYDDNLFQVTMNNWLGAACDILKMMGSLYVFNTPENAIWIAHFLKEHWHMKFRNWIVWNKKDGMSGSKSKYVCKQEVVLFFTKSDNYTFNYDDIRVPYDSENRVKYGVVKNGKKWTPNPKGKLCTDVWNFTSERFAKRNREGGRLKALEHITPKPIEMIERMVKASSNKGDIVLDPFMGSGTTAIAYKLHVRHFIVCDSNKEYVKYSAKRYKEFFKSNTERIL